MIELNEKRILSKGRLGPGEIIGVRIEKGKVFTNKQIKDFLKSFKLHFPSPKYLIQPTIDLTCWCKKDFDINFKIILSLFFFIDTFSIVLIGDFAPQDDALKVEKSCVPINNFVKGVVFGKVLP